MYMLEEWVRIFWILILKGHIAECQNLDILENGVVSSINYPGMYPRQEDHTQTITVTAGDYLVLWLDDLDLPPPRTPNIIQPSSTHHIMTSCNDYIRVWELDYRGSPRNIAIFCGNINNFRRSARYLISSQVTRMFVDLHVERNMPDGFTGRGYRLYYSAGFHNLRTIATSVRASSGLIPSRRFPEIIGKEKEYYIAFAIDSMAGVELKIMYFDQSESSCDPLQNYIKLVGSAYCLCGGISREFTITYSYYSGNEIYLAMTSNANFLLTYKSIDYKRSRIYNVSDTVYNIAELDFNGVPEGATCSWRIESDENSVVGVQFYDVQPYAPSNDFCMYNNVTGIDSSDSLLYYQCPGTNSADQEFQLTASSNVIRVTLNNASRSVPVEFDLRATVYADGIPKEPMVQFTCAFLNTPRVFGITPQLGILAGGTLVTIRGENLPTINVTLVYGDYSAPSMAPCTQTSCVVSTPPGLETDEGVEFAVTVSFIGYPIETDYKFTYRPNPGVNSIYPLKTLTSGGTSLTVKGNGFDAVAHPELTIHLAIKTEVDGDVVTTPGSSFTGPCGVESDVELNCPTPEIEIPEEFMDKAKTDETATEPPTGRRRRRDTADAGAAEWESGGQSLEFTLGINLDGDASYKDLTESLPEYSQIKVFATEPEFRGFVGTLDVLEGEPLNIPGDKLLDGLAPADYRVKIGEAGNCTVLDVTENEVVCELPLKETLGTSNETHAVLVHPGLKVQPHLVGSIRYTTKPAYSAIILGSVFTVVIVIISVAIFFIRKRYLKWKSSLDQGPHPRGPQPPPPAGQNQPPGIPRTHDHLGYLTPASSKIHPTPSMVSGNVHNREGSNINGHGNGRQYDVASSIVSASSHHHNGSQFQGYPGRQYGSGNDVSSNIAASGYVPMNRRNVDGYIDALPAPSQGQQGHRTGSASSSVVQGYPGRQYGSAIDVGSAIGRVTGYRPDVTGGRYNPNSKPPSRAGSRDEVSIVGVKDDGYLHTRLDG